MTVLSECGEDKENENEEKATKTRNKIFENRKESRSCLFPITLNKIEEVDETKTSEEAEYKKLKLKETKKKRRPRSAGSAINFSLPKGSLKSRPKSSCAVTRETIQSEMDANGRIRKRPKSAGFNMYYSWDEIHETSFDPEDVYLSRPSSMCSCTCACDDYLPEKHETWMDQYHRHTYQVRKCKSVPNFSPSSGKTSGKIFRDEKDFDRFKRSLKLLGFKPSDFGINTTRTQRSSRWKPKPPSSTFSTKVVTRSISLESLRKMVREAWIDDHLDDSHRRLLAQAAYEEWYFRKEKELWKRRQEDKMKRIRINENLAKDCERKKAKAEEEFEKWIQRKQARRKMMNDENSAVMTTSNVFCRLVKTKEESEEAFLKWKKEKDKERREAKKKEEEKKLQLEMEKKRRKEIAERAFQHWLINFEKHQKQDLTKWIKLQRKQKEMEMRKKREEESQKTFQIWKMVKDEQIRQRTQELREKAEIARQARLAQMEERMYEAERAFEEWLEGLELRKQKRFCSGRCSCNNTPWLPPGKIKQKSYF